MVTFSEALVVVCELDVALVVIFEVVAAGVTIAIVSDVAVEQWGLEWANEGWELGRGAVGRPGIECRRFRSFEGCFVAGDGAVVVVVDDVDLADGGCVGVTMRESDAVDSPILELRSWPGIRTLRRGVSRSGRGGREPGVSRVRLWRAGGRRSCS